MPVQYGVSPRWPFRKTFKTVPRAIAIAAIVALAGILDGCDAAG
jgi:hypothetical protein